jgi:hypothetical protein
MQTGKLRPDREVTAPRHGPDDKVITLSYTLLRGSGGGVHLLSLRGEGGSLLPLLVTLLPLLVTHVLLHVACFMSHAPLHGSGTRGSAGLGLRENM